MVATAFYFGAGVAAAAGMIHWVRLYKPAKDPYRHFRCPGCEQKLRCRASKAGRGGMCPRCGLLWTLPTASHALPATARKGSGSMARVGKRVRVRVGDRQPGSSSYYYGSGS